MAHWLQRAGTAAEKELRCKSLFNNRNVKKVARASGVIRRRRGR